MRDPLFSGFFLLDKVPDAAPDADIPLTQPDALSVEEQSPEETLQALVQKLSARFFEGNREWQSAIVSTLEGALEGRSAVLRLTADIAATRREFVRDGTCQRL